MISRTGSRRRTVWARQYLDAIIQRDIRDVASIDKLDHLFRARVQAYPWSSPLPN